MTRSRQSPSSRPRRGASGADRAIYLLTRSPRRASGGFAEWHYASESMEEVRACTACAYGSSDQLTVPLRVKWQLGSDLIADFSWAGADYFAVATPGARRRLMEAGWPSIFRTVVVAGSEKRRGFKSVPYPYTGPKLYWVVPREVVTVDVLQCGLRREVFCDRQGCPFTQWKFRYKGPFSLEQASLPLCFRLNVYEPDSPTYVSEAGKRLLERLEISNVRFVKVALASERPTKRRRGQ